LNLFIVLPVLAGKGYCAIVRRVCARQASRSLQRFEAFEDGFVGHLYCERQYVE